MQLLSEIPVVKKHVCLPFCFETPPEIRSACANGEVCFGALFFENDVSAVIKSGARTIYLVHGGSF